MVPSFWQASHPCCHIPVWSIPCLAGGDETRLGCHKGTAWIHWRVPFFRKARHVLRGILRGSARGFVSQARSSWTSASLRGRPARGKTIHIWENIRDPLRSGTIRLNQLSRFQGESNRPSEVGRSIFDSFASRPWLVVYHLGDYTPKQGEFASTQVPYMDVQMDSSLLCGPIANTIMLKCTGGATISSLLLSLYLYL